MSFQYLLFLSLCLLNSRTSSSFVCNRPVINIFMQCNSTNNVRILKEILTNVQKLPMNTEVDNKRIFNAAYGKMAKQSSTYTTQYHAAAVTNGLLSDYSHTRVETKPWLLIDLGKQFYVFEVEIYNVDEKVQCCAYRFHDANIRVGPSLNTMELCGHFTGPGVNKQRIAIRCPTLKRARYVKIQIVKGTGNYLHLAEVKVWAVNV